MARDPAAYVAALKRGEKPAKTVSHRIAGNNYLLANPDLPEKLMGTLRGGNPPGLNRLFTPDEYAGEQRRTRDQVIALLKEAAELQIESTIDGKGRLQVGVTVANRGAGHALPTGPLDQRYLWLELEVTDAAGRMVFHSGAFDATKGVEDPQAVRWVKLLTDDQGKVDRRHVLFDTDRLHYPRKPIAAGGSDRVDYAIPAIPSIAAGSYQVRARLWYRLAFQEILQNSESQGLGKLDVVIPPLLMSEARSEIRRPAQAVAPTARKATP